MAEKLRRTFELTAEHKAALDAIKRQVGCKTDTAAINYAVKLAAHLSPRKAEEVDQALWLRDELGRRVRSGGTLIIEKVSAKEGEPSRAELLLPPMELPGDDRLPPPNLTASRKHDETMDITA